jgi:alpha-mannosidase
VTTHAVRWTLEKTQSRLALIAPLVYRRKAPLAPFRYHELPDPMAEPPVGAEVDDGEWLELAPPVYWGRKRADFILRTTFTVPADWLADATLALHLPLGEAGDFSHPEALAYLDGAPYAACDRHHQEFLLPAGVRDGRSHTLALHGWAGMIDAAEGQQMFMRPCAVVEVDSATRAFIALGRVAHGTAGFLPSDDPARGRLLTALDAAFKLLDTREPLGGEAFYASLPAAHAALEAGVAGSGAPLDVTVYAAGHAHIDVAWLWTLGQTRRKAGRTFHTVLRLMEQFPDYRFSQSQPQLYDYVRQDYPELFEAIKERVADGRWETLGGMWVEADCNLTGAEPLARQFVLGRGFFKEHFGPEAETRVLWLPDVFGYAWSLPQLIKLAGLEYFFTIKISWSQYNRLPYDSFWWQGLDGTRVLTHFGTTPDDEGTHVTYNAVVSPKQVRRTWLNFQQKELTGASQPPPILMAYGYGDGGGGPTREMLENIQAMANFPSQPRVRPATVREFFKALDDQSGAILPVWDGELYLEFHRGTYTTQGRNKRANRYSEFLLHDTEFLGSLASQLAPGYAYPVEAMRAAWQLMCLNQFHDIIPGSSIGPVYEESQRQYAELRRQACGARDDALQAIAGVIGGAVVLINPTAFARRDPAFLPGEPLAAGLSRAGSAVSIQSATGSDWTAGGIWLDAGELPPYSVTVLEAVIDGQGRGVQPAPAVLAGVDTPTSPVNVTTDSLENAYLRVEFNEAGDITRIYDKSAGREVLPKGELGNQLQAFEDRSMLWDAWDVDIFYDDKRWLAEPASQVRVAAAGPLVGTLEITRQILNSQVVQRISLAHNSPRLDFETTVDWREHHIFLKAAFPVDVLSPTATFEIQWGSVQRPTHRNTSWDWARFETCAQKWVDLSEGGYGVSLLNNGKYGHDIHGNVMRISLLRSPADPDPEADLGQHHFTYSLYPHTGGWDERTIAEAYALNDPLIAWRGNGAPAAEAPIPPLIQADRPNVVIETIKPAEDGDGLIARLYESQRQRGPVTLSVGFPLAGAWRTNLLEENEEQLEAEDGEVRLSVRPFEIVTLRLRPQAIL